MSRPNQRPSRLIAASHQQPNTNGFVDVQPEFKSRGPPRASHQVSRKKPPKRSNNKKKGWLSRTSLQDAADAVGSAVKWGGTFLAALPNIEEKYFDLTTASSNLASTATIDNLSNIVQGTDYNQRLGNSIRAMRLRFDYTILNNASSVTTNLIRIIVFRDFMCQGADPTPAQVLETVASGMQAVNSAYLHYAYDRFEVLHDEVHITSQVGSSQQAIHRRCLFPINDHILYSSTAGADASDWQGSLYVLYVSNVATFDPTISYHSRLVFTDD